MWRSTSKCRYFPLQSHRPKWLRTCTWSWPVFQPAEKAAEYQLSDSEESEIEVVENEELIVAKIDNLEIVFNKADGTIDNIKNSKRNISFSGGPVPVGVDSKVEG